MTAFFGRIVTMELALPGRPSRVISSVQDDGTPGLRLGASVTRTASRQDDVTRCYGWGLAPATVSLLQSRDVVCRVSAGHAESGGAVVIGQGRVLPASVRGPYRRGGDMITEWAITDGGIDLRDVVVSESWGGEVSASVVLDRVITRSGLARGSIVLGEDVRWAGGYVAIGPVRRVLRDLARATGSTIIVQNGAVQAWPVGGVRRTRRVYLSSRSGLIDGVERAQDGAWTLPCLLLPSIVPGDAVDVESRYVEGTMTVGDVQHDVDSVEGPFYTTLTAREQR